MRTLMFVILSAFKRKLAQGLALLILVMPMPLAVADPPLQMTAGGLQFRQLVEGEGEPVVLGQVAQIHLVMWVDDRGQKGTELYNSRRDREPVSFVVGTDMIMPALNEAVLGMKAGGRRLLLVPPAFAYGDKGLEGVIAPETSVILLVDLISVQPAP